MTPSRQPWSGVSSGLLAAGEKEGIKMEKLLPPDTVLRGKYRITDVVGEGATSVVYAALDLSRPGTRWAVKEIISPLAADEHETAEALEMFRREYEMLKELNHPGLPKVIDCFHEERGHYLVMEYVEGTSLQAMYEAQKRIFSPHELLPWTLQLLDILQYLHSQTPPVVYRDLKPSNIVITAGGRAKLIDFGISRHFSPEKECDTQNLGTPGFSAPEQYGNRQTDYRSDIYSLGATLYFLMSGRNPEDFSFKFPPVTRFNPGVPSWMSELLSHALEADHEKRLADLSLMRKQILKHRNSKRGTPIFLWKHFVIDAPSFAASIILILGVLGVLGALYQAWMVFRNFLEIPFSR